MINPSLMMDQFAAQDARLADMAAALATSEDRNRSLTAEVALLWETLAKARRAMRALTEDLDVVAPAEVWDYIEAAIANIDLLEAAK